MAVDWNVVASVAAQLGGFALIGKWLIKSAEKANETLPVVLKNLTDLNVSVKELFESRNVHNVQIAEIKTGIKLCPSCNDHSHFHKRSTDEE